MNLIQITEQLKNPAVSVQQLMQYANNSNPQVPPYVALAEMQRRQSIQAPPQVPQQTVKDQLGASLMGLPAAPGAAPNPAPAPQQPQQPQQQPQQPQGMQEMQLAQVPMPQPKPALPTQPGMAGGGLTSIPLNMHHDFAAGGIIAFAGGGDTDPAAEYPKQSTLEEERAERLKNQALYNFGSDPYTEAKRRYAELEQKQLEREKNAGADRFWAGLSSFAGSGTKGFGESMGMAMKTAQDLEEKQIAQGDAQRSKMAELATLWGKEQDALNRANFAADKGNVQEKREQLLKAATYRLERQKAQASTTSAEASAQNAKTLEDQRKFEQEKYPEKFALEQEKARAAIKKDLADAARSGRPDEFQQRLRLYQTDPTAYNAMFGDKARTMTQDQMADNWKGMGIQEKMARTKRAGGDVLKAEQDYYKEVRGLASSPAANKPIGAPAVGTIQGGYRFKGGDPGNQSSWEKV
jgi:hypothetical protein